MDAAYYKHQSDHALFKISRGIMLKNVGICSLPKSIGADSDSFHFGERQRLAFPQTARLILQTS